jgi:ribosomal protein S18 acetylase RimI-like enzyme
LHPEFVKVPAQPTDPRHEVVLIRMTRGPITLASYRGTGKGFRRLVIIEAARKNGLYFLEVQPRDPAIPPFIVGYVMVDPTCPPKLIIDRFEVFAEFRGRSYGKLFAAHIEALLANHKGCKKIVVDDVEPGSFPRAFWKEARGTRKWSIRRKPGLRLFM